MYSLQISFWNTCFLKMPYIKNNTMLRFSFVLYCQQYIYLLPALELENQQCKSLIIWYLDILTGSEHTFYILTNMEKERNNDRWPKVMSWHL